jgi:SPP1 family predicted phage head-tail adaptor
MRAGRLRHRIKLQRNNGQADASGEVIPSWSDYATNLPAEYRGLGGREIDRAEQRTAVATAIFVVRYRDDVLPEDRVTWGERTFEVVRATDTEGRGRELDIEVTELSE